MRKSLIVFMVMVMVAFATISVSAEDKDKVSVTVTSLVLSKYIGSAGNLVYDRPVWQTDIFISYKDFYIDFWHSGDLRHGLASPNYGNEIDWTIGWAPNFKWCQLDIGLMFIDEPFLFNYREDNDYLMPYLEVRRAMDVGKGHILMPYVRAELLTPPNLKWDARHGHVRHDNLYFGIRYQWKAAPWVILKSDLSFVHGDIADGEIGKYDMSVYWPIAKNISLIAPAIKTSLPIAGVAKGHHSEIAVGSGITFNF